MLYEMCCNRSSGGKKKPVGGVALFGGADILKKKTETPAEEPAKVRTVFRVHIYLKTP